jgi:Tfp pilus assembly protein PilW
MSLVEVLIASLLFSVIVVVVDASINVVQAHQVQISDRTQALDNLQMAQQAITRDIHAAISTSLLPWTTPAVPTSAPSSPITAQSLTFNANLGGNTPLINISLNTSTHILTIICTGKGCTPSAGAGTAVKQTVANIDSSSLFTLTTQEVSTTANSATTNAFFFTSVASTLVLDTPRVGAPHLTQTTLSDPNIVTNNIEYSCQNALLNNGATGSC